MEEEFEDEFGGYDIEFVDRLSDCQICSICLLAMRDPVQTECGHRFCKSCLLKSFREGDKICPEDRNPIGEEQFFADAAYNRNILSLRVKCKQSERGCDWDGQLRYHEAEHFDSCEYKDVTCKYCQNEVQRRLLNEHITECQNRIEQCEDCGKEVVWWLRKFHEAYECPCSLCGCPQRCGVIIVREEIDSHVKDQCPLTVVFCPYQEFGCTFHAERCSLSDHIWESTAEHVSQTWSILSETKARLNKMEKDQIELQLENTKLRDDVATMRQQFESNKKEISSLKQLLQPLMGNQDEAKKKKRPATPLNRPKSPTRKPINHKSRLKPVIPPGRTDNSIWSHSPSSANLNRPMTAAASLGSGAESIRNENAKGKSLAKSPTAAYLTLPRIVGPTENENAKGKSLLKRLSLLGLDRPHSAAVTLPMGAGQIDNENATRKSLVKRNGSSSDESPIEYLWP